MQINWFTVIAQLVNFLVLVWLMKKYLYQPILQAIDAREKMIASELADAKTKMADAKKEQDAFQKKNEDFDLKSKTMMAKATGEADAERERLLDSAKKEAAAEKQKLEASAKELQEDRNNQLLLRTQQNVFSITKKVLAELASTNVEDQIVEVFIKKIKAISGKSKEQFMHAFQSEPVTIKSAFKLTTKDNKNIQAAIADILGKHGKYTCQIDPKLIGGIEIATKGYKLSWSLSAYVDSLEKSIATQ